MRVTTSGAAGTPATFSLPPQMQRAAAISADEREDWTADFREGFEEDLANWQVLDLSDDGTERMWGLDDTLTHSGNGALWVASGGANALDPATAAAPPALDTWLVSSVSFDLSHATMAEVEFAMTMDTLPDVDTIFVGASTDGTTFSGEYWSGRSGGWQSYRLDLSAFVGEPRVYLAWYFHSAPTAAPAADSRAGVWLDDITVWTYTNVQPKQTLEAVQRGTFETGDLSGWVLPHRSTVVVAEAPNPVAGQYVAYFGGIANASEQLYQPIAIPADDVTSAQLRFWLNRFGDETQPDADRFCVALYDATLATRLVDLGCLDGASVGRTTFDAAGWERVEYDLLGNDWAAIQGQTINVMLEMTTDDSRDTFVFVDDVALEVVTGGTSSDAKEPNDTIAGAVQLPVGEPVPALSIAPAADEDFFWFHGAAGDVAIVNIDAAIAGSTLDSVVHVLDGSGTKICDNDDDGYSLDSYLSCPLPATGAYYVAVRSYDGSGSRSATYSLMVDLASEPRAAPATSTPATAPPAAEARAWTAILYMSGDNNLCDNYLTLVERMESELGARIGPDGFLNIVVLFDRNAAECGGQGGTTRFVVQENGAYQEGVNWWDMGELNMGDPQTLTNFGTWAMHNYPAEHYYLAIDNHGNGLAGVSWDDSSNHDHLTFPEVRGALKQITDNGANRLDIFAYEACLLGMYETAYDLRAFTDYLFFFETISWTNNASYPGYLGHERFSAASNGLDLGKIMFETNLEAVRSPHALALVDTQQMDALRAAVDAWANALGQLVGTSRETMTMARHLAQKINTNGNASLDDMDEYIDLWDLADQMAAQGIAVPQSEDVQAAVEAAVVNAGSRSSGSLSYANTHGLSIYWAPGRDGYYADYIGEATYTATIDGTWDEFLQTYQGNSERPGLPVDPGPSGRLPAKGTGTQHMVFMPLTIH
jgi:hypothetical protein